MTRRPDLFIIGAPKAGTTSVYEWLKGHPEVYMSPSKEPRYFAPDLHTDHAQDLRYGEDEGTYLALFAAARDEKRLGEASVRYMYSLAAPGLIHEFQPDAYIVAMLRDPVDLVYSLHSQLVAEGREEIGDFESALAAEDDRRAGRRLPPLIHPRFAQYRDQARFGEQLPRWFNTFGRGRVHVIVLEEMMRDPAASFHQLLEFLQVDPDYQPQTFATFNPSWTPRSGLMRRLFKTRLPQWIIWQALPRVIGDRSTRDIVRRLHHSAAYRRPAPRPPMSPELRQRLEQDFAPDVARLSALLGRDMAAFWWGRATPESD